MVKETPPRGIPVLGLDEMAGRSAERERAIESYVSSEDTVEDIAKSVGVSRATMYTWLREEGLVGRRRRRAARRLDIPVDLDALAAGQDTLRSDLENLQTAIQETCDKTVFGFQEVTALMNRLIGGQEAIIALLSQLLAPAPVPTRRPKNTTDTQRQREI